MNARTKIAACCAAVLIAVAGCGSQEPPKPAAAAPTDSPTEVKVVEDSALAAPTTVEVASEPVIPDVVATVAAEQITGEGERIAHSLAGSTPANPYPINAFRNIFNRGVIPYNLMPRIQSGVRK